MKKRTFKKLIRNILGGKEYIKNESIHTCAEYFALPKEERETTKWWLPGVKLYLYPRGLIHHPGENFLSEWDNWHKETRKRYPIQYFLSEWDTWSIFCFIRNKYWSFRETVIWPVRDYIWPRNHFARKAIPNEWTATDQIIREVLFNAFLEHYGEGVEDWKHLNSEYFETKAENNKWIAKAYEYEEVYKWIKVDRVALQNQYNVVDDMINKMFESGEYKGKNYGELAAKLAQIEKKMINGDTIALQYIVAERMSFDHGF